MGILVEMLDSSRVEGGGTTDDTVDLVTLLDQELGKVRSVLTSDTYGKEKQGLEARSSKVPWQDGPVDDDDEKTRVFLMLSLDRSRCGTRPT